VIDFVVPDVDAAYALLTSRAAKFVEPPTDKPWGLRMATFLDPAGYTLMVTSYLPGGKTGRKLAIQQTTPTQVLWISGFQNKSSTDNGYF
jgi:hypothetical protein